MTEGTQNLLTLNGTLDVNDILSIVTSRTETKCHAELAAAKACLAGAEEALKEAEKSANTQYLKECRAAAEGVASQLRPVVTGLGGVVVIPKIEDYRGLRRERNQDGQLQMQVVVRSDKSSNYGAEFLAKAAPSAELLALEAKIEEAKDEVSRCSAVALEWRKKLSNIPMLERQTRAKLAEAKLSETEDGQKVLELLSKDTEATFLALPAN